MMHLKEYIDTHHAGNISEFARLIGKERQRVQWMVRHGFVIHEGTIYCPKLKLSGGPI